MDKKILLVNHRAESLEFLTKLLVDEGFQVWTAKGAASALEILETQTPDLILIEGGIARNGGKGFLQSIRRTSRLVRTRLMVLEDEHRGRTPDPHGWGADARFIRDPLHELGRAVLSALEEKGEGTGASIKTSRSHEKAQEKPCGDVSLSVKGPCHMFLDHISDGILEVTPDGGLLYANARALSMAGLPGERLSTVNLKDILRDEDVERINNLVREGSQATEWEAEGLFVQFNGREVSLTLLPVKDQNDSKIIVLKDMTDRKRMEVQLQEAQKMEAIATLAAGVAHDFNNLLMAVQGNTSLMLLDLDPSHPHCERLRTIEKQVQSGCQLTGQLLGYAMKGRCHAKPFDLNQVVGEVSKAFGRTRKEFEIHLDLCKDLFAVEADQGQIEQVLLNLFINASDAMPLGGEIFVETMKVPRKAGKDRMVELKPGDYVLLSVADTGVGMDKKTMKRIFDPFFTTKGRGRGHGLGLASAYGIIKRHGGHIEVDSEVGRGTRFTLYLPVAKGINKSVPGHDSFTALPEVGRGKGTVLSVDDEEIVRNVGREMLEALGYQVLTARDGEEAVRVFREHSDRIDIVLLDMIMPRMSGGEVYDRLKAMNPDVRVLLSSGYSMEGKAREILERGCNGFIQKPFKMQELSTTMEAILRNN